MQFYESSLAKHGHDRSEFYFLFSMVLYDISPIDFTVMLAPIIQKAKLNDSSGYLNPLDNERYLELQFIRL